MNTNSAFTGSFTENPFWYQQFDLRQNRILRGGQPIVDFDIADNCPLYVTTMKAVNFQDDIPSILIDDFKDHYVLVFDVTSMQDASENCHYHEFVGEPLRLELRFTDPLENVTELIVLGERMSSVAVDKFGVVGKNVYLWITLLCNKLSVVSLCSSFGTSVSFPSDHVPTLDNDTFAIINTQPSNMQGEHGIMIANFRHQLYFADSFGRKGYSFLKQHYKQMMPAPLQSHPSVCGFYTIYAAFHPFKFRHEEITGVHDVNVLSFISHYMYALYVNVLFISCFCPFLYILINFFKLLHNLFT